MQMGRCYDIVRYRAMLLRSIGIPATMDYVPHWGNYTGKHGIVKVVTIKQEELLENDNSSKNTSVLFGSASFLQGKTLDIKKGDLPRRYRSSILKNDSPKYIDILGPYNLTENTYWK